MFRSTGVRVLSAHRSWIHHRPFASTSSNVQQLPPDEEELDRESDAYPQTPGAGPSRKPFARRSQPGRPDTRMGFLRRIRRPTSFEQYVPDPLLVEDLVTIFHDRPESILAWDQDRLEANIRDLLACDRPLLAARILTYVLNNADRPDSEKRTFFSRAIIEEVFELATLPAPPEMSYYAGTAYKDLRMIARGRRDLTTLLQLLSALDAVRHLRIANIYYWLTQRLVAEGLHDIAAKIFVGQVEEWVTEGRIAQGGDPDAFYDGGGPPRTGRESLEIRSELHKLWWKGIRTWVLPGEVLSPHDRLDLWHPRKLRLPEKLRQFPNPSPTSPPTAIHAPELNTLLLILDNLDLGDYPPHEQPPPSFECSMRALAILASTVLSRTIPWQCGDALYPALVKSRPWPPVYPSDLPPATQDDDKWAYTAYTHVNLAIRSMILSPPQPPGLINYMQAFKEAAEDKSQALPEIPSSFLYMTSRLSPGACLLLLKYGLRRMRSVRAAINLIRYAKEVLVVTKRPMVFLVNTLYQELSLLKRSSLAQHLENILFGKTGLGAEAAPLAAIRSRRKFGGSFMIEENTDAIAEHWIVQTLPASDEVAPNVHSINILLSHLAATKQHKRFLDNVYRIMPFLQFSTNMTFKEYEELRSPVPEEQLGLSGRPWPYKLDFVTYHVILEGCRKNQDTGLAQRIFHLCLTSKKELVPVSDEDDTSVMEEAIPINVFRTMIMIWHHELNIASSRQARNVEEWPIGWSTPKGFERLPRDLASTVMIFHTYGLARNQWRKRAWDRESFTMRRNLGGRAEPDTSFFNVTIAANAKRWGLREGRDWTVALGDDAIPIGPKEREELEMVVRDMQHWGYQIPLGLLIRLKLRPPLTELEIDVWRRKGDLVCTLEARKSTWRVDEQLHWNVEHEVEMLERMEERREEEEGLDMA